MFEKLDHIGVAVRSIDESLSVYRDVFGMKHEKTEEVPDQKVKVAFLDVGGVHVELIEPTSEDSPVAKHLAARGEGLHHLAFRVVDIEDAIGKIGSADMRMIDSTPRTGAGGKKIAFVHPRSSGGVLTELVQLTGSTEK